MGSRVELFEQIRRDHDREGLSIRALAERHAQAAAHGAADLAAVGRRATALLG
jgi:hypothetical protein